MSPSTASKHLCVALADPNAFVTQNPFALVSASLATNAFCAAYVESITTVTQNAFGAVDPQTEPNQRHFGSRTGSPPPPQRRLEARIEHFPKQNQQLRPPSPFGTLSDLRRDIRNDAITSTTG